jgi:hypothetical protein
MTKKEAAIITAFTGIGFGGEHFSDFHQYAEEKFGHPIWTHQMADEQFWIKLKTLSAKDFESIAKNLEY